MTGFSAAQRRRNSLWCNNFRAASARSTKSIGPVWAQLGHSPRRARRSGIPLWVSQWPGGQSHLKLINCIRIGKTKAQRAVDLSRCTTICEVLTLGKLKLNPKVEPRAAGEGSTRTHGHLGTTAAAAPCSHRQGTLQVRSHVRSCIGWAGCRGASRSFS